MDFSGRLRAPSHEEGKHMVTYTKIWTDVSVSLQQLEDNMNQQMIFIEDHHDIMVSVDIKSHGNYYLGIIVYKETIYPVVK
jgi:hypothetical protein